MFKCVWKIPTWLYSVRKWWKWCIWMQNKMKDIDFYVPFFLRFIRFDFPFLEHFLVHSRLCKVFLYCKIFMVTLCFHKMMNDYYSSLANTRIFLANTMNLFYGRKMKQLTIITILNTQYIHGWENQRNRCIWASNKKWYARVWVQIPVKHAHHYASDAPKSYMMGSTNGLENIMLSDTVVRYI